MAKVVLRDVTESDLPHFFAQQQDAEAAHMAGVPSREKEGFTAHWTRILADPTTTIQTIVADGQVAGNVVRFLREGEPEVGYWLGKEYWGRGIATEALHLFLRDVTQRPLFAYVVRHNTASARVLEKCGFTRSGEDDEGLTFTLGAVDAPPRERVE